MTQKLVKVTKRTKKKVDISNGPNGIATKSNGAKQPHLPAPGMAPSIFADVNEAAEKLSVAREEAKSKSKAAKRAEGVLILKMKNRGQTRYSARELGVVIELSATDHVKLKKLDTGSKRRGRGREIFP
jgi:hypothetical protein